MNDGGYRKRLVRDLPRWREAGWVTPAGESAILQSLEGERSAISLAAIVGMLGALLLGAGVVAFVSANWELMPRLVRFGLLVAALAVAYGTAAVLARRETSLFSEAALLVAGCVFAAAIALVGQTYHLAGDFADAVLLWEIGMIGAALLTGSTTLTVLAIVGAGYWAWLNVVDLGVVPHWESLIAIVICVVIALRWDSRYARLIAVLTMGFWIAVNLVGFAIRLEWSPFEMLGAAAAVALVFWATGSALTTLTARDAISGFGHDMLWPGIAALLLAVGILQADIDGYGRSDTDQWLLIAGVALAAAALLTLVAWRRGGITIVDGLGAVAIGLAAIAFVAIAPDDSLTGRLVGGAIVLGAALWAINNGQTGPQRVGKTTGLAAFGIEIIYLYVVTLGTLMDTALAFLVGGILFIVLAYGLFRIDRRLGSQTSPPVESGP